MLMLQYKGTCYVKGKKKWKATFLFTRERYGGTFDTEKEAAEAFDKHLGTLSNGDECLKLGKQNLEAWRRDGPDAFIAMRRNFK